MTRDVNTDQTQQRPFSIIYNVASRRGNASKANFMTVYKNVDNLQVTLYTLPSNIYLCIIITSLRFVVQYCLWQNKLAVQTFQRYRFWIKYYLNLDKCSSSTYLKYIILATIILVLYLKFAYIRLKVELVEL